MIRKSPGLLYYLKLFLLIMLIYKLYKQGHLIKIFPFFKKAQDKIIEELDLAKDLDLPFKFVKKVKSNNKKKIKIPGWVFYLGTNKKVVNFLKNISIMKSSDPSNEYLDKKLINSILKEIEKLDED